MTKLFALVMGVNIIILLLLACAPQVAPGPAPTTGTPLLAAPVPAPVATVSTEETAWQKIVEAAKREGLVTIYGGAEFSGDGGRRTIEAFRNEYGIRVDLLITGGRQGFEKVKIENQIKQPIADIVTLGLSSQVELSLAGMLNSIWQDLPELRNRDVFKVNPMYTPNGDVLNMAVSLAGVLINTKRVNTQDEPRSYLDLLAPKWKGNMILSDPRSGSGGGFAWFAEMRYYKLLDDDYFRRFARQEPILWGGASSEANKMVGRGEAWLFPYAETVAVSSIILEGAPLKLLGMTEGSSLLTDPISIIRGAAHPNAAKLFINWLLSRKGQDVYTREQRADSVRKDVPDFVDPRVRLQPEPQKLLPRTYEVAEAANRYHKEGIAESIFGKK